jgi:hypothetical protein
MELVVEKMCIHYFLGFFELVAERDLAMAGLWSEMTEKHGTQPTSQHLGIVLALLSIVGGLLVWYFKSIRFVVGHRRHASLLILFSAQKLKSVIQAFGVQINKVARTAMEIERKIFHLTGEGIFFCLSMIDQTNRPRRPSALSSPRLVLWMDAGGLFSFLLGRHGWHLGWRSDPHHRPRLQRLLPFHSAQQNHARP